MARFNRDFIPIVMLLIVRELLVTLNNNQFEFQLVV